MLAEGSHAPRSARRAHPPRRRQRHAPRPARRAARGAHVGRRDPRHRRLPRSSLDPDETRVGTVNEDFAIESMAGDVFQLGNASWRIRRVEPRRRCASRTRAGQPPSIPFWLGEAPARTRELSRGRVRASRAPRTTHRRDAGADGPIAWLVGVRLACRRRPRSQRSSTWRRGAPRSASCRRRRRSSSSASSTRAAGCSSSCTRRSAAASTARGGSRSASASAARSTSSCRPRRPTTRSCSRSARRTASRSKTCSTSCAPRPARELLMQAILVAPMFATRWRWNATRALAVLRMARRKEGAAVLPADARGRPARGGRVPRRRWPARRTLTGPRRDPGSPARAADDRAIASSRRWTSTASRRSSRRSSAGEMRARRARHDRALAVRARDPRRAARTRSSTTRRSRSGARRPCSRGAGSIRALRRTSARSTPRPSRASRRGVARAGDADELHEGLVLLGFATRKRDGKASGASFFDELRAARRATVVRVRSGPPLWVTAERLPEMRAAFAEGGGFRAEPDIEPPRDATAPRLGTRNRTRRAPPRSSRGARSDDGRDARSGRRASARSRSSGARALGVRGVRAPRAVLAGASGTRIEWCERRLLARIHRYTLGRLRGEIEPVSQADYVRLSRLVAARRGPNPRCAARTASPPSSRSSRVSRSPRPPGSRRSCRRASSTIRPAGSTRSVSPGDTRGSGGPSASQNGHGARRPYAGRRSRSVARASGGGVARWSARDSVVARSGPRRRECAAQLAARGASFFDDLVSRDPPHPRRGRDTGSRSLRPMDWSLPTRSPAFVRCSSRPRTGPAPSLDDVVGTPSAWRAPGAGRSLEPPRARRARGRRRASVEAVARTLLRRYGVVLRRIVEREAELPPWRELLRAYRRLEARGDIRGGRFVAGFSGEQYALPEAVEALRAARRAPKDGALVSISAADPLNLVGIVTPGDRIPAIASNRVLFETACPWLRRSAAASKSWSRRGRRAAASGALDGSGRATRERMGAGNGAHSTRRAGIAPGAGSDSVRPARRSERVTPSPVWRVTRRPL